MQQQRLKWLMTGIICFLILFCGVCFASEGADINCPRENAVVKAVKKVSPAVVNISSEYEVRNRVNPFFQFPMDPFFKDFFDRGYESRQKSTSLGSGVIIDGKRGFILTNDHVIAKGSKITVMLNDGRSFKADIVGADPESDLAVLRIKSDKPLPSIEMGDSSDIMIGETVIAIGNPFGLSNTVTTGVISAINRSVKVENKVYNNFLQTDASINPGNSGGPLLNIDGELIGINTAIYAQAEGIGFAIPINKAKKIISDLIKYGEVVHAWIGISVQNIGERLADYLNIPADSGVVVQSVESSSPAASAGIQEGDLIRSIDKTKISSLSDYENVMRGLPSDKHIKIIIQRNGKEISIPLITKVFPESLAMNLAFRQLGIKVVDINEKRKFSRRIWANTGVIISEIDPQCELASIGVRPGDVIRKINDSEIDTTKDFKKAVIKNRWKESLVILVQRGGQGYYITIKKGYDG